MTQDLLADGPSMMTGIYNLTVNPDHCVVSLLQLIRSRSIPVAGLVNFLLGYRQDDKGQWKAELRLLWSQSLDYSIPTIHLGSLLFNPMFTGCRVQDRTGLQGSSTLADINERFIVQHERWRRPDGVLLSSITGTKVQAVNPNAFGCGPQYVLLCKLGRSLSLGTSRMVSPLARRDIRAPPPLEHEVLLPTLGYMGVNTSLARRQPPAQQRVSYAHALSPDASTSSVTTSQMSSIPESTLNDLRMSHQTVVQERDYGRVEMLRLQQRVEFLTAIVGLDKLAAIELPNQTDSIAQHDASEPLATPPPF
jgi:hypothetical protein